MNMDILLPVISKVIGRDLTPELLLFYRARAAIGTSLNDEGKEFFIANWRAIVDFMETKEGQTALADFMDAWGRSLMPESLTTKPEETTE